jgi:hypothetical protein
MAQPETLLVNKIRAAVKKKYPDSVSFKVHGGPYQTGGVPDLLVFLNGKVAGFEVKKQKLGESEEHARERATLRQRLRIDAFRKAGCRAEVVLSVGEVLTVLADLDT